MRMNVTSDRLLVLTMAVGLLASPAAAQTVGVYRGAFGAREAGLAGADGVLGVTPVDAMVWNPAGLALLEAPDLDLAIASLRARGKFTNRVDPSGGLQDAHGMVPDAAFAFPFRNAPIVVGGALVSDAAIGGSWKYQDVPGAAGATYGLATHRSAVLVLRSTAGVGARLGDRVAVGGSLSLLWNRNELRAPYIFQTSA